MSVLKAHRSESKAEYINVANKIYIQTINFLSRLSSRYSRLVASEVSSLASEVLDHTEKANSIYPSDAMRKELRKFFSFENASFIYVKGLQTKAFRPVRHLLRAARHIISRNGQTSGMFHGNLSFPEVPFSCSGFIIGTSPGSRKFQ